MQAQSKATNVSKQTEATASGGGADGSHTEGQQILDAVKDGASLSSESVQVPQPLLLCLLPVMLPSLLITSRILLRRIRTSALWSRHHCPMVSLSLLYTLKYESWFAIVRTKVPRYRYSLGLQAAVQEAFGGLKDASSAFSEDK